jgi:hypothetical protein
LISSHFGRSKSCRNMRRSFEGPSTTLHAIKV